MLGTKLFLLVFMSCFEQSCSRHELYLAVKSAGAGGWWGGGGEGGGGGWWGWGWGWWWGGGS